MEFEIDARLNNRGEQSAFMTHAGFLCGRGWSVEQHLSRKGRDGEFLTDVRQLDPRWFTYETDIYGMTWGCIETLRSKASIESQFNLSVPGDTAIVKDLWNSETEFIYLGSKQIDERDNPYGYPPFIVQAVTFGAGLLKSRDAFKRKGESIFYPHRDMFAELNYMASLLKTQSYEDLRSALQQPGNKMAKTPKKYPGPKSILPVDQPLLPVPTRGMTAAMQQFNRIIEGITQRAGLSDIDEGTLNFPLSAIALTKMMAVKDSLTLPRLSAMAELYQARTRMMINQAQRFGSTIEIGQEGMKRKYDTSKLSGPYTIEWGFRSDSLEGIAAKVAIGNSMRGMLSDNDIRRDVWQRVDTKADEDALEVQEAKEQEPIIKKLERIFSLIDENTEESNIEAWILHHSLTTELKQRVAQGVNPTEAQKPATPTQQLPIFGGRSGGPQPAGRGLQTPIEGEKV
jgi:hypothetical protein